MSPRLTVLFGGTFDPPHVGHVLSVAWLASALDADVWVLPVHRHILGKDSTPFHVRLHWCRLAFGVFGDRVQVRTDEERPQGSGATVDLVRYLQEQHPDRTFRVAVGSDILAERHRWVDFPGLVALAPLIVLPRPGYPVPSDVAALVAPLELPDVSATEVRADWAAGRTLDGRVPATVLCAMGSHAR